MVAVYLGEDALDYVHSALADADGLADSIQKSALRAPIVFVTKEHDLVELSDLSSGGVSTQELADAALASFITDQKKKNFSLCSVLFQDPWSKEGDLDYARPPPDTMITLAGRIYYLHDLASITPSVIRDYRARSVSFLKIIYVLDVSVHGFRQIVERLSDKSFEMLGQRVRFVAISAYDDESWIIARHEL